MTAKPEQRLLEVHSALNPDSRDSLLSFAEFLLSRQPAAEANRAQTIPASLETPLESPLDIPRPEQESVVAAIRRLRGTYPMVPRKTVFQQSSTLMTRHIIEGANAGAIIDQLEALFLSEYDKLKDDGGSS